MRSLLCVLSVCGVVFGAACGGADPEPTEQPVAAPSSGGENTRASRTGVEISGTLGTIPTRAIDERFEMKQQAFLRCFFEGSESLDVLGGSIEFYFRVANDGSVRWVIPRASTVGDRATERCLLNLAGRMRFPAPQGGDEAEFAKAIEVDAAAARPPVSWDASRVGAVVQEEAGALAACGGAQIMVTAYVAPGGTVLAAGVATRDESSLAALDCVADAVKRWHVPDPGSYPAKVTFSIP